MHCPKCGQHQVSEETRFCSRCGFLLTGVAEVVAHDGVLPQPSQSFIAGSSPRRRGVMQGAFIFLLSFLIVPLIAVISIGLGVREPFAVAIAAILLTAGGLLRVAYALMFESGNPRGNTLEQSMIAASQQMLGGKKNIEELPPAQSIPASAYARPAAGTWRDTNDLATPGSVTDPTTKLLPKNEES